MYAMKLLCPSNTVLMQTSALLAFAVLLLVFLQWFLGVGVRVLHRCPFRTEQDKVSHFLKVDQSLKRLTT